MFEIIRKLLFGVFFNRRKKDTPVLRNRRVHIINATIKQHEEDGKKLRIAGGHEEMQKPGDIEPWQEKANNLRNRIRTGKSRLLEKGSRSFD